MNLLKTGCCLDLSLMEVMLVMLVMIYFCVSQPSVSVTAECFFSLFFSLTIKLSRPDDLQENSPLGIGTIYLTELYFKSLLTLISRKCIWQCKKFHLNANQAVLPRK